MLLLLARNHRYFLYFQEKDADGFTARDFMLENGHADLVPLLTTNPQLLASAHLTVTTQRKQTAAAALPPVTKCFQNLGAQPVTHAHTYAARTPVAARQRALIGLLHSGSKPLPKLCHR